MALYDHKVIFGRLYFGRSSVDFLLSIVIISRDMEHDTLFFSDSECSHGIF
jgi:hypothetical protein